MKEIKRKALFLTAGGFGGAILGYFAALHHAQIVPIPTCPPAELVVPKGAVSRAWGNGVEVDYPDGTAKIYFCNPLKAPSPK